jgi:hypothetical protein
MMKDECGMMNKQTHRSENPKRRVLFRLSWQPKEIKKKCRLCEEGALPDEAIFHKI